jgi:hypothetical protein
MKINPCICNPIPATLAEKQDGRKAVARRAKTCLPACPTFSINMKRRWMILLLLLFLVMTGDATAKRGPAPLVPPIDIAGIEYRAPNSVERRGVIEACDVKTGKLLWRKRVYLNVELPFSEADVQWVFIKSMTFAPSGDRLVIINERGRQFTASLAPPRTWEARLSICAAILLLAAWVVLFFRNNFRRRPSSARV